MSGFLKFIKIVTFNYFGFGFLMDWLAPKQKTQDPQALQDPPTAKQGDPIRWVFGRFRIEQANTVWHGDVKTTAVKAKGGKKG